MHALTKERDALRHGSQKLTSATDLLKEKDDIIRQVSSCGKLAFQYLHQYVGFDPAWQLSKAVLTLSLK